MKGAASTRDLAAAVGKSQSAVMKWVADARWPFARRGPWDGETVSKIVAWAAATLAPDPAAADREALRPGDDLARSEKQVRIKGSLERAKYTETRRKILEEQYLLKEDVEAGRVERINAVKGGLFDLVDSGLVEMMRAADNLQDAKDLLRARFIQLCQAFAAAG